MDSSIIKKQIGEILESISEQTNLIKANDHKIPQIELDIVLENIRKLYEYYHQLDCQNTLIHASANNKTEAEKEKKPDTKEQNRIADDVFVEQAIENTQILKEKEPIVKTVPDKSKKSISDKPDPDLFSSGQETLSDKLKNDKKVLHDQLVADKDESLADKMQKNAIEDLKAAIGINEKFLFINELFKGDMEEYKKASVSSFQS